MVLCEWIALYLSLRWYYHSLTGTHAAVHSCTQDASQSTMSTICPRVVQLNLFPLRMESDKLCSSKNLISRSKRLSEVRLKGWDEFTCMVCLRTFYPCPSKHSQLRTNLDDEFVFNRPWAGSGPRRNKCSHYSREHHGHPPLLSWLRWCLNTVRKSVQGNVTKGIHWALTTCPANGQDQKRE